jgi:glycosyltransferase involved in cell wall biosynthesis
VRAELPRLRPRLGGADVAVFHDAIAFHEPAWGVAATRERYPDYLRALAGFRGIACVSDFSRRQLLDAWEQLGIVSTAEMRTVRLGLRVDHLAPRPAGPKPVVEGVPRRVLCVSTLEPRKQHAALLDAAETLWAEGRRFELHLIGLHNRGFPPEIPRRIAALRAADRPLRWEGAVSARELDAAYAGADLTIYPSSCEGFGLPVWESLHYGVPCLTTDGGALAEIAPGGGTLVVPAGDRAALTTAWRELLENPSLLDTLGREAQRRPLRSMAAYAADLEGFLAQL